MRKIKLTEKMGESRNLEARFLKLPGVSRSKKPPTGVVESGGFDNRPPAIEKPGVSRGG